ncbi:hypothetical protein, partial [Klebsiella pneumoniae]|uniref:hypothetical protein n=1 Tax=Klebsiella pneumoniae TaxID=573 RepID=UPI001CDD8EA6
RGLFTIAAWVLHRLSEGTAKKQVIPTCILTGWGICFRTDRHVTAKPWRSGLMLFVRETALLPLPG